MPRQKTIGEERRNTRQRIRFLRRGEEQRVSEEEKREGKVWRRVKGG